ncbi:MAG: hypothetical protein BWY74_03088 [Firmicutes bacterium ADurb.Bin419]|nr:MAG: hypothetical protein BWY74_03088 [Firmicutes bacterium ADurb.Bin419]
MCKDTITLSSLFGMTRSFMASVKEHAACVGTIINLFALFPPEVLIVLTAARLRLFITARFSAVPPVHSLDEPTTLGSFIASKIK